MFVLLMEDFNFLVVENYEPENLDVIFGYLFNFLKPNENPGQKNITHQWFSGKFAVKASQETNKCAMTFQKKRILHEYKVSKHN